MSTGNTPCSRSPASDHSEYEPTLNGLLPLPQRLSSDSRISTGNSPASISSSPSSNNINNDDDGDGDDDYYQPPTEIATDSSMDFALLPPASTAETMPTFKFSSTDVEVLCVGKIDSIIDHTKPQIIPKDYREWREGFAPGCSQREILLYAVHQITSLQAQLSYPQHNDGGDYDALEKAESFTTGMPLSEMPWTAVTEDAVSRMSGMVVSSGIVQACFALNYIAYQMASASSRNVARRVVADTLPQFKLDHGEVHLANGAATTDDQDEGMEG